MKPNNNLTIYSHTFPETSITSEILLDSKIREIERLFMIDDEKVMIIGPTGSGKTTFLMQFVKSKSTNCFSYFFSDNYWELQPTSFIISLCNQMSKYLGNNEIQNETLFETKLDIEKQKRMFQSLYQSVIEKIKITNEVCYFVIDGIEKIFQESVDKELCNLIQLPTNPKGLYFLGSINSSATNLLQFKYKPVEPHYFSLIETIKYLEKENLSENQIVLLQNWSGGVPGLLMIARQMIKESLSSIEEIISEPKNFEKLLENQWNYLFKEITEEQIELMCLIAYSIVPLSIDNIVSILSLEKSKVESNLVKTVILKLQTDGTYVFYPESYKSFVKNKLAKKKTYILNKLINYYKLINEKISRFLLPQYFNAEENYGELSKLLTPDYLLELTLENNDISIAQNNLENTIELAKQNQDIGIIKFVTINSQFHELSDQLFGISEVEALVSLKKFDKALEYAYSTKILTMRIRLLAKIYSTMEKAGQIVLQKAIDELVLETEKLDIETIDSETIINTAADLFPLLPDISTQLVEKAKNKESKQSPVELFALFNSVNSEDPQSENLLSKISSNEIRDYALSHSPWLAKLSVEDVLTKAEAIKNTKAKEYLLRHWCNENHSNPELDQVIQKTLDVLTSDPNYRVPLRNLRQLSASICFCNQENRGNLIQRFEIPLFSSLQSPFEEKIRLQLNFIEAIYSVSEDEAFLRMKNVFETIITTPIDIDVLCYCFSRIIVTLTKVDNGDKLNLKRIVYDKLQDGFIRLINNSASQLDVTKRVLRSLATVDVELALTLSSLLNSVERRDVGIQEVLTSYIQTNIKCYSQDIVIKSIFTIIDSKIQESVINKIVELVTKASDFFCQKDYQFCVEILEKLTDPIIKAKGFSYLLSIPLTTDKNQQVFEKLLDSWEQIDIIWMKIECAYSMVCHIAEANYQMAQDLFDRAAALARTTSLANQSIGIMYYETLRSAAKLFGKFNPINEKDENIQSFYNLYERIPSKLLKLVVISQVALSLLRNDYVEEANFIIQEKIIPGLQNCCVSNLKSTVISDIALVLYEYSPDEAKLWVDRLSYNLRNITWVKVVQRILTQSYICDQYFDVAPKSTITLNIANQIINIISNIERDQEIYSVTSYFCKVISEDTNKLTIYQKIDLLTKLEGIVTNKLPDPLNITHSGYLALCLGEIDVSKQKSAKHLKQLAPKSIGKIINITNGIQNDADRVLVFSELGLLYQKNQTEAINRMLEDALKDINKIENTKDRLGRLENIAENYGQLRNTTKATEVIKMTSKLIETLEGVEKDKILSSMIQTAYQFDKEIASELTEKIETGSIQYQVDLSKKAHELSKSPQKISTLQNNEINHELLNEAAIKMNKAIAGRRNVSLPKEIIVEWLSKVSKFEFSKVQEVFNWAIDSLILQSPNSDLNNLSKTIFTSLLECNKLLIMFGSNLSNFSTIPDDLKINFQGYSVNKKLFKVGDRKKALDYITEWIKENVKQEIVICDPYFDLDQLWLIQAIPNNIKIRLLCSIAKFDSILKKHKFGDLNSRELIKKQKELIKNAFESNWYDLSKQTPPTTLVIIHNSLYNDDEFHDRFILSVDSGISIGTSLNGLGNKECFITTLPKEDVENIYSQYIYPKISLEKIFADVIYFDID